MGSQRDNEVNRDKVKLTPHVVRAINEELDYTSSLVEVGRSDDRDYGLPGQLLTLQTYARKAIDAWVENPGNDKALHEVRKCAAIACRALVREGCPTRSLTKVGAKL